MKKYLKPLYNGIIKENPTFVLMLGSAQLLRLQPQLLMVWEWDLQL